MKINDQEGKTLMALRAGPTGSHELYERFPSGPSTSTLQKKGLIELKGAEWHITELGRQHCPTRRTTKAPVEKTLAVLLQEQSAQQVVSKPETIEVKPVFNIVKAVPEKDTKMSKQPALKAKTKVLQMLEAIEKFPGITSRQINLHLGFTVGEKFIPSYIERGLVILGTNDKNEKTYTLKEGYTAESVYATKNNAMLVLPEPAAPAAAPQVEQAKPAQDAFEIPSFLINPQVDLDLTQPKRMKVDKEPKPLPEPIIPTPSKVRFAFTSDNTLIIMGAHYQDIELTAQQTEALFEFIESASLMLPLTSLSAAPL